MSPPTATDPAVMIGAPSGDDWRLLVESVADYAIFILSTEGYVASWNIGAERIKGYRPDEIIGRHFSIFYPIEDIEAGKPERELLVAREVGRIEDEGWRVRKDGTRFWANVVITALRDKSGALRGFAKVTRDLSEGKQVEERLIQSEERLRLLIESASDYAIYMLDPHGLVTTWNAGAERMKGYSAAEIIGQHFSLFFPALDVAQGKPERELEIARSDGRFEDEGWRIRKDGGRFWVNVVINAIHGPDGKLLGFAKITRDLTARREAEETERNFLLEQAARTAAEEATRTKEEFLATVSHELRTPLSAIVGWASLLKGRIKDPELAKGIDAINRSAEAQTRIVDDLLDVSRIITGKLTLELKPTDLVAITSEAIDGIRPSAAARGVAIQFKAPDTAGLLVADPVRLRQVVSNLLSNALKFSDGSDSIEVWIEQQGSTLMLFVLDHGQGIEPRDLPHIFERFRQADSSTTRHFGGLGLGLAIVRHIVEHHGGRVHAESAGKNRGAMFRVTLPIRAVVPADPVRQTSDRSDTDSAVVAHDALRGVRVLVVDDDDDTRALLEDLLVSAGATVVVVASAAAGLANLGPFRPDVLVSDIAMPGEDGYSLLRRVRALRGDQNASVPSLALTAYSREEDRRKAVAAGFSAHLGKPVKPAELIASVARLATTQR